ncbi:MAG TPA: carbon-nitrogen hydrolase family protein [Anaerolineaceae bacterium]|nr:carbon-nitrogen hydrolase family protein [Anaerolineaceae bacterium]
MQTKSATLFKSQKINVSVVQYQMLPITSWDEVENNVRLLTQQAYADEPHFLLFPEYFSIHYFECLPPEWAEKEKLDALIEKYDQYIQLFRSLANENQCYIIGGSFPVRAEDGKIYNVAHLFSPSGGVYTQEKLHITPLERQTWNYSSGNKVKLFDTPYARIGIQICYDIEFPEVTRLMALNGVDILFTPFFTGDRFGYQRVRYSAQARAVENTIYSVISGSTANLTLSKISCYSQSAILTPSDVGFPLDAVLIEAGSGIGTVISASLDLVLLHDKRLLGTVRPLMDRREDLYSLNLQSEIEIEIVE